MGQGLLWWDHHGLKRYLKCYVVGFVAIYYSMSGYATPNKDILTVLHDQIEIIVIKAKKRAHLRLQVFWWTLNPPFHNSPTHSYQGLNVHYIEYLQV